MKSNREKVVHPAHYNRHPSGLECLLVVERMQFCAGNAVKYLWRAHHKGNKIEDIKKAQFYLTRVLMDPSLNLRATGDRTLSGYVDPVSAVTDDSGMSLCCADIMQGQYTGNPSFVLRAERSLAAFLTGA